MGEFLKRTPLSEYKAIVEAIDSRPNKTEWIVPIDDTIYSIVLIPIKESSGSQLRAEEAARMRASVRARHLLFMLAIPRSRAYINEDATGQALTIIEERAEERLKITFSSSLIEKNYAFAIVAAKKDGLAKFSENINSNLELLDIEYCSSLYPKAKSLFERGDYQSALEWYVELHRFKWAKPRAYLEAAECFLRTGDKESAAKLALDTEAELQDKMGSSDFEYAGDILLEAENEKESERIYRKAIEKMRSEK